MNSTMAAARCRAIFNRNKRCFATAPNGQGKFPVDLIITSKNQCLSLKSRHLIGKLQYYFGYFIHVQVKINISHRLVLPEEAKTLPAVTIYSELLWILKIRREAELAFQLPPFLHHQSATLFRLYRDEPIDNFWRTWKGNMLL